MLVLSGSATPLRPAVVDMILYGEVISADEMEGTRRSNQQLIRKMLDSDRCQELGNRCATTHTRT